MQRKDFIRLSGLTTAGLITGLSFPFSAFTEEEIKILKLEMPEHTHQLMLLDLDKEDAEQWVAWLLRLAASSIVTALGAKLVDRWMGDCYCNGTSCSKNNASYSNYSNTEGVYGYAGTNHKFVKQELADSKVGFKNASVPFLDRYNSKISNLEGPFLAGACWAANDIKSSHSTTTARSVISPVREISNGGYRFDTAPCYPTKYQTEYGQTEISFSPNGYSTGGDVTVKVKDAYDNLAWNKTYEFSV